MRRLVLAACFAAPAATGLALSPLVDLAPLIQSRDWQLLAIDGQPVDVAVEASLRIEPDGSVIGKAPCNSYGSRLTSTLPAFQLGPIRATRMACDRLAEEQAYFDALALMLTAELEGDQNLILRGEGGHSLEFVHDRMNSLTVCRTCGD